MCAGAVPGYGELKYKSKGILSSVKDCVVLLLNDIFMWTLASWKFKGAFKRRRLLLLFLFRMVSSYASVFVAQATSR